MSHKKYSLLRGLGCAVICRALHDLQGPMTGENLPPAVARQVVADAEAFFLSDCPDCTVIRQFWCDVAGVEPAEVQDAAVRALARGSRSVTRHPTNPQP